MKVTLLAQALLIVPLEARLIAAHILGKPLPSRAVVHHVDEDPTNNTPSNLVICEDRSYHMLLHRRTDALKACGHASWRKCVLCKEYDNPKNLVFDQTTYHESCLAGISKLY